MVHNKKPHHWQVYIIQCSDQSLYTGITTDIEKRFARHKNKKGAKYFYSHVPEKIVFLEMGHDRSSASQREYEIKTLSRTKKLEIIREFENTEFKTHYIQSHSSSTA